MTLISCFNKSVEYLLYDSVTLCFHCVMMNNDEVNKSRTDRCLTFNAFNLKNGKNVNISGTNFCSVCRCFINKGDDE